MKNVIDLFIAISLLLPQFLSLAIGLLQFLQFEPYTTNTSVIRLFIDKLGLEVILETLELWQSIGSVDEDLVLGQEAQKRGVETWNWRIYQWKLQKMKDLSVFSLKTGFFFIILLKKTR